MSSVFAAFPEQESPLTAKGKRPLLLRVRSAAAPVALLVSFALVAQDAGIALSGSVTDSIGKTVPGATITFTNVATGQATAIHADLAGAYAVPGVAPGDYDVSVTAPGYSAVTTRVSITSEPRQTVNLTLRTPISLEDLGLSPAQAQGSVQDQALLDKRSHMLKLHQRYGLIALAPLLATVLTGSGAKGSHDMNSSTSSRDLHAALGITAVTFYSISAYYAIAAPRIEGTETKGHIKLHKALAWVHGTGMILTPILGALAYQQKQNNEKVHGIASAHGAVAVTTVIAYGAAILTEVFK
jgi:hypothetical protein